MKERITNLLTYLKAGVYEKDPEINMAILAAIAGESIILLGPPGVAKSMVANRLTAAFADAKSFVYLMSRFSTPDEIFGPVSIAQLKKNDKYERATDGYLPTADVVFLDEIWKAGPAIQNTLLTVINEKTFRNGDKVIKLPLKLLIAASNELPANGEGLEALWDRFIIRLLSKNIESNEDFCRMLTDQKNLQPQLNLHQILPEEYQLWQQKIENIEVPQEVLNAICYLRQSMHHVVINEDGETHDVYVSDRRWKMIVHLLRASAFMQNRVSVSLADLLICTHCLWQEAIEIPAIRHLVMKVILNGIDSEFMKLKEDVSAQLRLTMVGKALQRLKECSWEECPKKYNPLKALDFRIKLYDGFFCHIANHGTGQTYFYFADFIEMSRDPKKPSTMLFYTDDEHTDRTLVRFYAPSDREALNNVMIRNVYRDGSLADFDVLYIDGVKYHVDLLEQGEKHQLPQIGDKVTSRDLSIEVNLLQQKLDNLVAEVTNHMFCTKEDIAVINDISIELTNRIRNTAFNTKKIDARD